MAQTLLGKIKLLVMATLHGLVDQALRSNSLAVFDEYIRDAERSMETLKSALVDLKVTISTLKARYDEAANEAARLDMQIDASLQADKPVLAKVGQSRLNHQLEIARTYQEQYDKQTATYNMLLEVTQVLQSKVEVLRAQRQQVATLLELVKSKKVIAQSIQDVEAIADNHSARMIEDIKTQLDQADARLEGASTRLSSQIEQEIGDSTLNAQLEARRQKLGLS
ncbi:MAG TPA: PspA/IM30 family protein [Aggregatilineales bacterium]|nr:PspA/IM30 family protein [Aggregatilineales bacterium]